MAEIIEKLSTYIARLEEAHAKLADKPIITSSDVRMPTLYDGDIKKVPIGWFLMNHNMFYVVTVPEGKKVPRHSHDEDVFRYIIKGSLLLNGEIEIKEGMWFVIKAGAPYEIETKAGYVAFATYKHICRTTQKDGVHTVKE